MFKIDVWEVREPLGEREDPNSSWTHPVTARREEEESKGRIRREEIQGKEMREERKEDKPRHADIPATQGRRIADFTFQQRQNVS